MGHLKRSRISRWHNEILNYLVFVEALDEVALSGKKL